MSKPSSDPRDMHEIGSPRWLLERMRAVRANRELHLKQQLIRGLRERIVRAPILSAQLREFARPVGHDKRPAIVDERRVGGATRPVIACAGEPPAPDLVIAG